MPRITYLPNSTAVELRAAETHISAPAAGYAGAGQATSDGLLSTIDAGCARILQDRLSSVELSQDNRAETPETPNAGGTLRWPVR